MGFVLWRRGQRSEYRHNGHALSFQQEWFTLMRRAAITDADANAWSTFRGPGPWKIIWDGGKPRYAADFPVPPAGASSGGRQFAADHARGLLRWGLATAVGEPVDPDWRPPSLDTIREWVPEADLTIACDAAIRQGQIVVEDDPGRLALRFEILERVPAELSDHRKAWLQLQLRDAHTRFLLVRLYQPDGANDGWWAEVDLTGADRSVLKEGLLTRSLACLRRVVANLVPVVSLIADPGIRCEALETRPSSLTAR
jgi:hypothetical protein